MQTSVVSAKIPLRRHRLLKAGMGSLGFVAAILILWFWGLPAKGARTLAIRPLANICEDPSFKPERRNYSVKADIYFFGDTPDADWYRRQKQANMRRKKYELCQFGPFWFGSTEGIADAREFCSNHYQSDDK